MNERVALLDEAIWVQKIVHMVFLIIGDKMQMSEHHLTTMIVQKSCSIEQSAGSFAMMVQHHSTTI